MILKIYKSWAVRHVHPTNFILHLFGIPMAVLGLIYLFLNEWLLGSFLFVAGYLLQIIGHRIEGNEVGEWTLIKKIGEKMKKLMTSSFVVLAVALLATGCQTVRTTETPEDAYGIRKPADATRQIGQDENVIIERVY